MSRLEDHYVFNMTKRQIFGKRAVLPNCQTVCFLPGNRAMCCEMFRFVYYRSESWPHNIKNKLLNYFSTHKESASSAVSNWFKETFKLVQVTTL